MVHETEIENMVLVKDIMTRPVISVEENECIPLVARLMKYYKIGCVVVTNKEKEPLGIITEKDLVIRVLTKVTDEGFVIRILRGDTQNSWLNAGEVMTSPVVVISPENNLIEAARKMRRHNIRRLVVVSDGRIIGIITNRDILNVTPEIIEILREEKKIAEVFPEDYSGQTEIAGYCEECGNWFINLNESNGGFLCEECAIGQEPRYTSTQLRIY